MALKEAKLNPNPDVVPAATAVHLKTQLKIARKQIILNRIRNHQNVYLGN